MIARQAQRTRLLAALHPSWPRLGDTATRGLGEGALSRSGRLAPKEIL
jgi:hypothetical protein